MLVLSRKLGQQIVIPQCELAVTVLGVEGSSIRLGVSAPADIAVYREEVWQKVRQQIGGWARETADQTLLETFAAELASVAYAVALRTRTEDRTADLWINLELSLWKVLAKTVKLWRRNCRVAPVGPKRADRCPRRTRKSAGRMFFLGRKFSGGIVGRSARRTLGQDARAPRDEVAMSTGHFPFRPSVSLPAW